MKKRLLSILLTVCMVLSLLPTMALGASTAWDGSSDKSWYKAEGISFTLTTAEQLAGLAALVNDGNDFAGKTVSLGADIVLNYSLGEDSRQWTPIGDAAAGKGFAGTFDGCGHTVNGLYINNSENYQALFGNIAAQYGGSGGTVRNLGMVNGSVTCSSYGAGIVGESIGTVANCYSAVTVTTSNGYAAGIVAGSNGTATNCYNIGIITGGNFIGGIASAPTIGSVNDCYSLASAVSDASGNTGSFGSSKGYLAGWTMSATVTGDYFTTGGALSGGGTLVEKLNSWVEEQNNSDYYTWQIAAGVNGGYPVQNAPLTVEQYSVTVTTQKDGAVWDSGRTFSLKSVTSSRVVTNLNAVQPDTYRVLDGGGDTGTTVTVTSENASVTLDYYTISGTVSDYAGGGHSVFNLTVRLYTQADTSFQTPLSMAITGNDGSYSIVWTPGSYVVRVAGVPNTYGAGSANATLDSAAVTDANIMLSEITTERILITSTDHKTAYQIGDTLDVTNLQISAYMSDGTTKTIAGTDSAIHVTGFNSSSVNTNQTLTVTYDGKTTAYVISISRAAYNGTQAGVPTVKLKTETSVTLTVQSIVGETVEYAKSGSPAVPTNGWQDSTSFTGISGGVYYYFFARVKETAVHGAGTAASAKVQTLRSATVYRLYLDISKGDIVIDPADGGIKVTCGGSSQICSSSTEIVITGSSGNRTITANTSCFITFSGITITPAASSTANAMNITAGTVTLTLADDTVNTLKPQGETATGTNNNKGKAALRVASSASLIINGSTGKLIATGGNAQAWSDSASWGGSGAGIGGDAGCCFDTAGIYATPGEDSGSVTINGGVIIATGGCVSSYWGGSGSGIGGGGDAYHSKKNGASGAVTINGGFVTAVGGAKDGGSNQGSGIGGAISPDAAAGATGMVAITDGTVIATGGIGTSTDASTGILTITGGSLKASAIGGATPTNGTSPVYKATFIVQAVTADGTKVTGLTSANYNTNDIYTVDTNKVYLYLPEGNATANYNGDSSSTNVTTDGTAVFPVRETFTATASMSGYIYGGTVSTPSVSQNPGSGAVTYYYSTENKNTGGTEWKSISNTTLSAGDYYMYAVIDASGSYAACTTDAVKFTVSKATWSTPAAPTSSGTNTSGSITVISASGQMYFCQLAGSTAPTSAVPGWSAATGTTLTFPSLSPNQSYNIYTYIPEDTNHNISGVSPKLNTTTASAKVTAVTAPGNVTLTKYYTTGSSVIPALPGAAKAALEGGGTQYLNITWTAPGTYNTAPSAANTYTWSVSAPTNYTFDTGVVSSGSITVTNKAATSVTITATTAAEKLTRTYAGSTFTVTDLFSIDSHAGAATYSLTAGSDNGSITKAGVLTVTKAGTFTVQVDTAATGNYAAGSATAELTISNGTGSGTVTIADWVYGGTAKTPAPASSTNGTGSVTYSYEGVSGTSYTASATPPTAAGSYKVTATFAATDLYNECSATDTFSIAKAPISFAVTDNNYTYDAAAHKATVAQAESETPVIAEGKYTVTYKLPADGSGTADKTDAGVYDVIVTISDDNFCFAGESDAATRSHKVGTLTIKQNIVTALWKNTTTVYDGTAKSPILELVGLKAADTGVTARLTESKTNADTYAVTAELTGTNSGNYTLTNPNGTFIIQRAPVSFALSGNSVKKGESVNVIAAPSVNGISYTLTYWQSGKQVVAPTETGSYDVYAEITNPNYRHAGGTDGAAQKIGVLTIYESNTPATYTVSFDANGGTGGTASMAAAQTGTVRILPESGFTSAGKVFAGWQYGTKTYQTGECFTQPSSNATLKALWNDKVYSIGGTVQEGYPVSNAANVVVTLMLGSRQIGQTVTGADGTYSFADVVPGVYNLVANKDGVTQTVMVTIKDKAVTDQTITMPAGKLNSVVEVKAGSPSIVVGDLEKAFTQQDKTDAASKTVELKLTAEAKAADSANNAQQEIEKKAGNVDLFLDFSLTKTVDGTSSSLDSSPVLLTAVITLPAELQDKDSYTVYRYHGTEVQALTTTANTDGEKIEVSMDKTTLTVYTKNFSAYAIKGVSYSGGGVSSYKLTFEVNGGIAITALSKTSGATVDLSAYTPVREGYTFAGWYSDAKLTKAITSVKLTANTTVYAKWTKEGAMPFTDVPDDAYYYDAVLWALDKGVTSGTTATTFNPGGICTRAQAVTFLWRAMGSPGPTSTNCPFTDVKTGEYYYKAVLWATEKGITKGTSDITFSPNMTVTRGQAMTFLWRTAGNTVAGATNPFADVKADSYYADAVLWAVKEGITSGTGTTTFSPNDGCSRAQIVTFLYRYLSK